jgi:hypothetical protein
MKKNEVGLVFKDSGMVFNSRPHWGRTSPQSAVLQDMSRFKNDGTTSGVTWVQLSSGLWVISCDGSDYIDCGTNASVYPLVLTFSLWISPSSVPFAGYPRAFTNASDGGLNGFGINGSNGNSYVDIYFATGSTGYGNASTALVANAWYFIAGTFDGTNYVIYQNNTIRGTAAGGIAKDAANHLYIGRAQSGSTWNGRIALPKLWNYALTAAQIRDIYDAERNLFK